MSPNEPLIHWPDPLFELVGFIASFLAAGAVGFRITVLRSLGGAFLGSADESAFHRRAAGRAAAFGLAGAAVTLALFAYNLPELAARKHLTIPAVLATPNPLLMLVTMVLALLGFTLALGRVGFGWVLAGIGVVGLAFRAAFFGQWRGLVNPVHVLAGGMWIGTLFMLVTCGLALLLRSPGDPARRGAIAAHMVNAFSPFALFSAAVLAIMGVITAWLHLERLDALWNTPYGITLIIKLCVVAGVVALGAWNWRRQRPRLGSEAGAIDLRKSATGELVVAGIVLVVTSILVSLPSPRG